MGIRNTATTMTNRMVAKSKPLPAAEELRIVREYKRTGNKALRDQLVNANLKLVMSIVHRYNSYTDSFEDLFQEGVMGLTRAIETFDPNTGNRLMTYATWWVRAFISRYVWVHFSLVRVCKNNAQRIAFYKTRKARDDLRIQLRREPTQEEVAVAIGLDPETAAETVGPMMAPYVLSLNRQVSDEGPREHIDILADDNPSTDSAFDKKEALENFHNILSKVSLTGKEYAILYRRYLSDDGSTLEDIASHVGVTRERIRQIELGLMKRLKKAIKRKLLTRSLQPER